MTRNIFFVVVLGTIVMAAQNPPAHSGHTMAEHQEHMQNMCSQMMQEHAAEMKAISQTLHTNLAQMKATIPMINDVTQRDRWQANIAMWQAMADHFSKMAQHAEHMQSMGMGCGMMEHGEEPKKPAGKQE